MKASQKNQINFYFDSAASSNQTPATVSSIDNLSANRKLKIRL